MEYLMWLVFGGAAGLIAAWLSGLRSVEHILLNVTAGIVGAWLGWMAGRSPSAADVLTIGSIATSFAGAAVAVTAMATWHRSRVPVI